MLNFNSLKFYASAIDDSDRPLDIKLWFSNKEMNPDSLLGDYTNNRDETRLVVTLTDSKSQPERKAYSKEEQEKLYIVIVKFVCFLKSMKIYWILIFLL